MPQRTVVQPQELNKVKKWSSVGQVFDRFRLGQAFPSSLYWIETKQLPLSCPEADAFLASTKNLFTAQPEQPAGTNVITNLSDGLALDFFFVAFGVGVLMVGPPRSASQDGALITRPGTPSATPQFDSCDVSCAGLPVGHIPATLYSGGPVWDAFHKLRTAYRFQLFCGRNNLLVNEAVADVGTVQWVNTVEGAGGSSMVPMAKTIRTANDRLKEMGCGIFIPQNVAGSMCVPPPLAPATWGHPKGPGVSGKMWCFPKPICFAPGMPLRVQLVANANATGSCGLEGARRDICTDCTGITPDADLLPEICGTDFLSSSVVIPEGCMAIGALFYGLEIDLDCFCDWASLLPADSPYWKMFQGNPHLMGVKKIQNAYPRIGDPNPNL